jgi:putative transposase
MRNCWAKIEAVIKALLLNGEGHRKVWTRLRADGVRKAARRLRRIMREDSLLAGSKDNAFRLQIPLREPRPL